MKQIITKYLSFHLNSVIHVANIIIEFLDISNVFNALNDVTFTLDVYFGSLNWSEGFQIIASNHQTDKSSSISNSKANICAIDGILKYEKGHGFGGRWDEYEIEFSKLQV